MNRAQIGVVVVAVLGVLALSGAATTLQTTGGGDGSNQSDIETIPIEELNGTPTQVYIEPVEGGSGGGSAPGSGGDGDRSGDDASNDPTNPLRLSPVLLGIIAVVLVVAAVVGVRLMQRRDRTDEDEPIPESSPDETEPEADENEDEDEEEDDAEPAIEDLGRSAGRAADHLADTERPSNAVHRAWYEMTRHLDVSNPQASTPEEFADAAVAAGMDREDVAALTKQFELVRYAGRDTTPERVSTAETALRRIEDKYAEDA